MGARAYQCEARALTNQTTCRACRADGTRDAPLASRTRRVRPRAVASSLLAFLIAIIGCEADPNSAGESETGRVHTANDGSAPNEHQEATEALKEAVRRVGGRYPAALETVTEKHYLRVLTSRNSFDFFIHRGQRGGYQYEMVRAFAKFLNERHPSDQAGLSIEFELIPVDDDQLIPLLLAGVGDLIAARLTVTPERSALVRFSAPYRRVDELVVTHDETPALDSIEDLSGRTVAIRRSSSYADSLAKLNRQLKKSGRDPIDIVFVDKQLATERILDLVAARRFDYTVADSIVAEVATGISDSLYIVPGIALRRGGELAWATLPAATLLAEELDLFLRRYGQGTLLGNIAIKKYFEAEGQLAKRLASDHDARLSDYDDLFREHAVAFGLDWRLAASMAYQESRFDPTAHNRWGAVGLFQIKPKTAREPYIDIPDIEGVENVSDNIRAGLKYLHWIKTRYFDSEPEILEPDRLRLALAAYNAGPRNVIRARSRATQLGLDPDQWFRHVELAMLDMRKTEPVKYVSDINQRFLAYLLLGVE